MGSTFYKDLKSSENKIMTIQDCSFIFKNLETESGWEINSKNSKLLIMKSFFYFESELKINFKYFIKSSSDKFNLVFNASVFNIRNFDFCIYVIHTINTSITLTNLKIEDEQFKGSYLYLVESQFFSKDLQAMKINVINSQLIIHNLARHSILIATKFLSLFLGNCKIFFSSNFESSFISDLESKADSGKRFNHIVFERVEFLASKNKFVMFDDISNNENTILILVVVSSN